MKAETLKQFDSLTNISGLITKSTSEDAVPIISANNLNIKINIINTNNTTTNSHVHHHHHQLVSASNDYHLATKGERATNGTILHEIRHEEANYLNIKESR
jgi:hypothetical protein